MVGAQVGVTELVQLYMQVSLPAAFISVVISPPHLFPSLLPPPVPSIGFAMPMYSVHENATALGVAVQGAVAGAVQVVVTSEDGTAVGKHVLYNI